MKLNWVGIFHPRNHKVILPSGRRRLDSSTIRAPRSAPFTRVAPAIEDWLTDLGPSRAKFLLVTALDEQDIIACTRALVRIEETYVAKVEGMRAYRDETGLATGDSAELTPEADRFFARLASSDLGIPPESSGPNDCAEEGDDLAFYREMEPSHIAQLVESPQRWWGIIYNRIPCQMINGEYEYKWGDIVSQCKVYGERAGKVATRCSELFAVHPVGFSDAIAFQFLADCLRRIAPSTNDIKISMPEPHQQMPAPVAAEIIARRAPLPKAITEGSEEMLSYLGDLEDSFRRVIAPVWVPESWSREHFQVEWPRFAPAWLFTAVLRSEPARLSALRSVMMFPVAERIHRAMAFLNEASQAYVEEVCQWLRELPAELSMASESHGFMPTYAFTSLLTMISLRQATRKSIEFTDRERRAQISRAKRVVLMACQIHRFVEDVSLTVCSQAFWERGAGDEQMVRSAENLLITRWQHLFGQQRLYATQATKEYMAFSGSQLALVAARDDMALVQEAAQIVRRVPDQGAMAAVVDRVLEETLTARRLSTKAAFSIFASVSPTGSGERADPLRALLAMDEMKDFTHAIRPVLGQSNWDLL